MTFSRRLGPFAFAGFLFLALAGQAMGEDRYIGYYYPPPQSDPEVYGARATTMAEASRASRIGFVTAIAAETRKRPYPPPATIFAKGDQAQKLIIVALQDGFIDTIYRARALFADMTAQARLLPIFQEMGVQDSYTFFDLAKLLGFSEITISNGRDFTHQVLLQ
jgi:hypothetical protein